MPRQQESDNCPQYAYPNCLERLARIEQQLTDLRYQSRDKLRLRDLLVVSASGLFSGIMVVLMQFMFHIKI
jgi:hypothetical protein